MNNNIDAIQHYYTELYADFIYKAGLLPFDQAKAMLCILPGKNGYNVLEQLTEDTIKFTVGGREIIISRVPNYEKCVNAHLDGDDILAWPNSDLYEVLFDYELYPTDTEMLTDDYLKNWGKHLQDTRIFIEPWCESLSRTAQAWFLHH